MQDTRDFRKIIMGLIFVIIVIILAKYADIATKGTRVTVISKVSTNILTIRLSKISKYYNIDTSNKTDISTQKEMYVEKVYKKLIVKEETETYVKANNQIQNVNSASQIIYASEIRLPKLGEIFARINIPACGINTSIVFGLTQSLVDNYDVASQDSITSIYLNPMLPGYGRPLLMGGHNYKSFGRLRYINVGNLITVSTSYGVFYYTVVEAKVAKLNVHGTTIVDLNTGEDLISYYGDEVLQLYTCDSLDMNDTHRFFVKARKTGGTKIIF